MEQPIHKPLQRQSPLVTEEVMNQLIDRGLVNGPKLKLHQAEVVREPSSFIPKEGTFAQTIVDILTEMDKPINRVELVRRAIQRNPPRSKRPQLVYHDVVRKLANEGLVVVDKWRGEKVERHIVSLA
jgi:hypothetical protein